MDIPCLFVIIPFKSLNGNKIIESSPLSISLLLQEEAKRQSVGLDETPRGSWASSIFDLKNSSPDVLLPSVLERTAPEDMDRRNTEARQQGRHSDLLGLYPPPDEVCLKAVCICLLLQNRPCQIKDGASFKRTWMLRLGGATERSTEMNTIRINADLWDGDAFIFRGLH